MLLEFAYNSHVSESTGEAPFNLLLGYLPMSPLDQFLAPQTAGALPEEAKKFADDIKATRQAVQDALAFAQDKQKLAYDKARRETPEHLVD